MTSALDRLDGLESLLKLLGVNFLVWFLILAIQLRGNWFYLPIVGVNLLFIFGTKILNHFAEKWLKEARETEKEDDLI